MAGSFYYLAMYHKEDEREKELRRWIAELRPIQNDLGSDFDGNINSLNRKLDSLQEDLLAGVTEAGPYTFKGNVNSLDTETEPVVGDSRNSLSQADSDLSGELSDLENKRRTAEQNRDSYYQSFLAAKAREEEEARRAREAAEAAAWEAEAQAKAAAQVAGK